ncbi:ribonuclease H-like domain-containing protein [Tanacetum coccineum]
MQKTILKQQYENFAASRSEGLDKTYDRFQKLISQMEIHGEVISQEDANMKFLRSQSSSSSSSNSHNVAFVSSENTSSTNETVHTAHDVSTANSQGQASFLTYADDVMFSFFANQSNSPQLDNEDRGEEFLKKNSKYDQQREALKKSNLEIIGYQMGLDSLEARIVVHKKNEAIYEEDIAFLKESDVDDSLVNDRFKTDDSVYKTSKDIVEKPKTVRPSAPIIEDWDTDSDNDSVFKPKYDQTKPKFTKINFVKSDEKVKPVNTAAPKSKVKDALPKTYSYFKAHSRVRRAFNQKSAAKTNNFNEKVKTTRANNVTNAGSKAVVSAVVGNGENAVKVIQNILYRIKGFLIVDAPGKIRTGKLDFKDVYFVKELKFNFFSVSQMCDKKNSVLFTETECIILSPDFKLLDESQVLLKVPRQKNMYNFDLKSVVPSGSLTCLFAKATIDESNLWHRRLGHINFKTMNKLGRGNLVRGSRPDWLFDIDLLTNSMNYEPVTTGNQTNKNAGIKDNVDATNGEPANKGERNGQEKDGGALNKENDYNVQDFRV